jgi:hypothetical protein
MMIYRIMTIIDLDPTSKWYKNTKATIKQYPVDYPHRF